MNLPDQVRQGVRPRPSIIAASAKGSVGGQSGVIQTVINGETMDIPNPGGANFATNTSVAVLRLENGRYQIVGPGGHWAPPAV